MAIKDTIKDIKEIIQILKDKVDKGEDWNNTATHTITKKEMEQRIAHLLDKKKTHTSSPKKLDNDLKDLETKASAPGVKPVIGIGMRYLGNA